MRGLEDTWGRNGPGMFSRLGCKEYRIGRIPEKGRGVSLRQEMRPGELTCEWSGKQDTEGEKESIGHNNPLRLFSRFELSSIRHTSFPYSPELKAHLNFFIVHLH